MVFGLVLISPILGHLGIRGVFTVAATLAVLFVVFRGGDILINHWFTGIALFCLLMSFVPAIYWMDARFILAPVFLIFSLFLIQLADQRALDIFLTIATRMMVILLIGGIIAFVLVLNGARPLFEIANGDGRPNYFFYTTFSNSVWRVIRPAGIYDEAGTLSFMVCGVAALRHLRGRDSRLTWLMLGMGFITLSLAHLIYVFFHFLAERIRFRNIAGVMATLLPLILIVGYVGGFDIVEKRLLGRVAIAQSGEFVGDNRSARMLNALDHLRSNPSAIFIGAHPSCRFDYLVCKEKYPLMGENPLSPIVFQGIFLSWAYYLTLALLFLAPVFGRKYLVSLAIGALLLQRPFLLDLGYSLIVCLLVAVTIDSIVTTRFGRRLMFTSTESPVPITQIHARNRLRRRDAQTE